MNINRYGQQPKGMEKIQAEIKAGPDNITLAWIPRWLLSPTSIREILADEDKHNASVKITVTNAEDKDRLLKNSLWFGGNRHRVDGFVDIS